MTEQVTLIIETSDEIAEIAKALPKAQAAMGEVFKTANNPAFKSKYADLASVVDAVVPALNKHGISMLQPSSFDGDRVHVATMFLHESGQWMRCTMSVLVTKRDAHGIGSAQTYCRRYGLLSMSGVAPEDDDANGSVGLPTTKESRPAPQTADAPAPTLKERADRLSARLASITNAADLDKAFKLASGLLAELDAKNPELLADVEALYKQRQDALAEKVAA